MKRTILAGASALALLVMPVGTIAKSLPEGGMTADEVAAWLQSAGYRGQVVNETDGTKSITTSSSGTEFHIYLYDCKDKRCGSLEFSFGIDTKGAWTADKMNDWNRDNRWGTAYVDKEHDPWLNMNVDLTPGGSYELLDDEFTNWQTGLSDFCKLVSC